MSNRVKTIFYGSVLFLVLLNMFIFNFWSLGIEGLKPVSVTAATTATYYEKWTAQQLAMTSITDWGSANLGSKYYLTSSRAPGWISGASRTPPVTTWWAWWWWCCWWRWWWWWGSSSSTYNFNAHLDPHAFVTQWHVDGTLTK